MQMMKKNKRKIEEETIYNFIYGQLRPNKVLNPHLLRAFASVHRASFLPPALQPLAYSDANLPSVPGRFFMAPLILARLMNLVEIKPQHKCLVIGGLSGYSSALLTSLQADCFVVEDNSFYCDMLKKIVKNKDQVREGELEKGWPGMGPFDWILIEGGIEFLPDSLSEQLKEGGSLVTVHNKNSLMGSGCICQKHNGIVTFTYAFDAYVPTLTGFKEKRMFSL